MYDLDKCTRKHCNIRLSIFKPGGGGGKFVNFCEKRPAGLSWSISYNVQSCNAHTRMQFISSSIQCAGFWDQVKNVKL